jgi:hypothetical protein
MGYLVEGLELFIRKVAYTKYDATVLVRWSNYTEECREMSPRQGCNKAPADWPLSLASRQSHDYGSDRQDVLFFVLLL